MGAKSYYYLHISSYRKEVSANQDVERLKAKGYNAIARREQIPKKGYWYRVYIGPFSAHMEAYLTAKELKKKKIVDYFSIQKKGAPIGGAPVTASATEKKTSKPAKSTKVAPPKTKKTSPPPKQTVKTTSTKTTVSKSSGETQTAKTKKKKSKKPFSLSKEGYGRNMEGGTVALGFRYANRR